MTANRIVEVQTLGEAKKQRDGDRLVTFIPMRVKRRGFKKIVISPGADGTPAQTQSRKDSPLIKAVGRAFHWQRLLDTGDVVDSTELARREKLDKTFVNETLRFALLAPEIVEAILAGRQPPTLTLQDLRRRVPDDWAEQLQFFGFDSVPSSEKG